ncbi:MAG: hypothetical protein ACI9IA_000589 [Enterobacterales bacterium]|jgi:hypothetical protein
MIWRRFRIRGNTSLADLHHIIQIAMGWDNEHLHLFHIYAEDYGIAYEGGLSFSHNAKQVFVEHFGFDVGDRFTYTYNFTDNWLCDIRIEAIEPSSKQSPWCIGGSGRHDNNQYYKADEAIALLNIIDKVIRANETTTVEDIRPLIEHYEMVRSSQRAVNKELRSFFARVN